MSLLKCIKGLLLPIASATLLITACGSKPAQPASAGTLSVNPSSIDGGDMAFTSVITVTADCDWGVAATDKDWCSVSPSGGVAGTTPVTVKITENTTSETRTNTLTFRYGSKTTTVPVTQTGKEKPDVPPTPAEMVIPEGYALDWNEEFDTDGKPSLADWWYETGGGGWGNNEIQTYVASAKDGIDLAYIKDGSFKIEARRINGTVYSIRINTKRYWQYGWFEARIKVSDVLGSWPAFWMMPQNYKTWPGDGEIDIMEYAISTQGKDKSSSSIHCNAYNWPAGTQKTHVTAAKNAATEYHVYALEWTAEFMKFYVDGNLHFTYKNDGKGYNSWPFDAPFYLKFNLAYGGNMGGQTDDSQLPAIYEIDYVRVFQKK